jgi:hypothetical protein
MLLLNKGRGFLEKKSSHTEKLNKEVKKSLHKKNPN